MGIVGSVIGAFTLAVAWAAAKWAKRAALHTEEGAVEAKRAADAAENGLEHAKAVSDADLRPWIQISVEPHAGYNDPTEAKFFCRATLKNLGRTPAQDVWVGTTAAAIPTRYYEKYGPQEEYTLPRDEMDRWQPILPGAEITRLVSFEIDWADTEPPFTKRGAKHMCPYFGVHVSYAIGGGARGETVATFQIGLEGKTPRDIDGFFSDHERELTPLRVKEGVRGKIT
jgi:hypothetical protein